MRNKTHNNTIITVKNISKHFDGVRALENISLDVQRAECLVIAGANGSGKTVFAKIIAGLIEQDAGSVGFGDGASYASVGLVFQEASTQILGETVLEDTAVGPRALKLSPSEVDMRVKEALSSVNLLSKMDMNPRFLSGGEQRRLAVAGIAAMKREIIIFDEPFAHLDYYAIVDTLKLITALKHSGKTVLILTHELEKCLAHADRLFVLETGKAAALGTPKEVIDSFAYGAMYGIRSPLTSYAGVEDCTWL